ncbi:MAG: hypothetical protein QNL04_10380 [SAR324 cluster bacterium]|nr:hypothetical protein [SAR324 cluster bacterium]
MYEIIKLLNESLGPEKSGKLTLVKKLGYANIEKQHLRLAQFIQSGTCSFVAVWTDAQLPPASM